MASTGRDGNQMGVKPGRVTCPHSTSEVCEQCRTAPLEPLQSPDPRDERIAELERDFNELHDMHVKVRAERDQLRARVQELERVASIRAGEFHRVLGENLALVADRDRWKDQARERKTACLAALAEVERLTALAESHKDSWTERIYECQRLREALEYYACEDHYESRDTEAGITKPDVLTERGEKARQALSGKKEKKDG